MEPPADKKAASTADISLWDLNKGRHSTTLQTNITDI